MITIYTTVVDNPNKLDNIEFKVMFQVEGNIASPSEFHGAMLITALIEKFSDSTFLTREQRDQLEQRAVEMFKRGPIQDEIQQ